MTLRLARAMPALIALAVLHSVAAAAQATPITDVNADAKSAVTACSHSIGGAQHGLAELERQCPDLAAALQTEQIGPLIIESSRDRLDKHSLLQLQRLAHGATGPAPAVSALTPFLQKPPNTVHSRAWWQRLWDWLLEKFMPNNNDGPGHSWLGQIARALAQAQWLWKAIIWGTIIALPIVVVVLVIREVRAMGRRSIDDPVETASMLEPGSRDSRLALLRRTPLAQRPAKLFAMLVSRLVTAGRLPPDRSLTHREIARVVLLDDTDQRRFIDVLARLSERQLYADAAGAPDDIKDLLAHGEDLYTTGWSRPVERQ